VYGLTATSHVVAQPGGGSSKGPFGTPERTKSFAGAVDCSLMSLASVQAVPAQARTREEVGKVVGAPMPGRASDRQARRAVSANVGVKRTQIRPPSEVR